MQGLRTPSPSIPPGVPGGLRGATSIPSEVAQAIAAYVRTILSGNSPYDRFQAGDRSAMSASAQRGLRLFEGKALCSRCHAGFNFTGEGYRNIGVGMDKPNPDLGFVGRAQFQRSGTVRTTQMRGADATFFTFGFARRGDAEFSKRDLLAQEDEWRRLVVVECSERVVHTGEIGVVVSLTRRQ